MKERTAREKGGKRLPPHPCSFIIMFSSFRLTLFKEKNHYTCNLVYRTCSRALSNEPTQPHLTSEQDKVVNALITGIQSSKIDEDDDARIQKRIALSRAITLVESKSPSKRLMADVLLDRLRKSAMENSDGKLLSSSFRLGIAGPPGVGKSTFVDAFGQYIISLKEHNAQLSTDIEGYTPDKIAVLCVDPSSHVTGGSILGDKTRMSHLSYHPRAVSCVYLFLHQT